MDQQHPKTMIVTGASQGIGAGVTKAFLDRGYDVVANSLDFKHSELTPSPRLALIDGEVDKTSTAIAVTATAIKELAVHQDSTTPPIIERLMESSVQQSGESMRTKATTNL
jgi:NAD(P)-dependent dehydrogenase (short-subunit alcohol dehydrogenase family)